MTELDRVAAVIGAALAGVDARKYAMISALEHLANIGKIMHRVTPATWTDDVAVADRWDEVTRAVSAMTEELERELAGPGATP